MNETQFEGVRGKKVTQALGTNILVIFLLSQASEPRSETNTCDVMWHEILKKSATILIFLFSKKDKQASICMRVVLCRIEMVRIISVWGKKISKLQF